MPRRFPPHPLTSDEAARLVEACGGGVAGRRNRALVTLLYRAGLRSAEACSLRLEDVGRRPGGMTVRVHKPKGAGRGKPPRELGLDPKAAAILEAYLEQRGAGPGPLFPSRSGDELHPSYLRQLLPRLARRAGIGRRVHPHALRHTFARELYDEGVPIVEIMLALRHDNLGTTQKYLRSVGASEVVSRTQRRVW